MNNDRILVDRMRYTKNTTSSRLALLAIFFNVLYFVSVYKLDLYLPQLFTVAGKPLTIDINSTKQNNLYYTGLLGGSIIYNLVFMLVAFLSSEGVKNYKKAFSRVMVVLAVLQVARIFILPAVLHNGYVDSREARHTEEHVVQFLNMQWTTTRKVTFMGDGQYIRVCLYLIASAVCLLIGARINAKKSSALAAHIANLESLQA